MGEIIRQLLEYYHFFGLLNIFLLYVLLLAYSDTKASLWYGLFVLSIVLDLFNYKVLYWLFNYSPNFTLPYLPWSIFSPIAFFKFIIISESNNSINKKIFHFLSFTFIIVFSYFIIKSYLILLGDLSARDFYFSTHYLFPYVEYWATVLVTLTVQVFVLIQTYFIIKKQPTKLSKDFYFLILVILIMAVSSVLTLFRDEPNTILSFPNEIYLTVMTTMGLLISYRKIIGLDSNKRVVKQKPDRNYSTDKDILDDVKAKILNSMTELELYKNQKLQLKDLSKAVKTPEKIVSEVLVRCLNTNYYDFVNGYRVKEVIKLMNYEKYQDYKLMALATESGFNSKTTFNSAFKKFTGKTPSEYRKHHFLQDKDVRLS